MTGREKAEHFSQLLDHATSLLTVCLCKDCAFAEHIREQMVTLEWERTIVDLKVDERGVSGTLECGFVFMPWHAIVCMRSTYAPPRLRLIKGGK
jgi:predicted nucleic-acid-binding Zn-ribbon protein